MKRFQAYKFDEESIEDMNKTGISLEENSQASAAIQYGNMILDTDDLDEAYSALDKIYNSSFSGELVIWDSKECIWIN